jgi:hypothetical protein
MTFGIKILFFLSTLIYSVLPLNGICQPKKSKASNALLTAIKHYEKYKSVQRQFKYTVVLIDSSKFANSYLFTFCPSNQKFLILPDSDLNETFVKVFPNNVKLLGGHLILWSDGTGNNEKVKQSLRDYSLLDSFYLNFNKKDILLKDLDNINYPTMLIDDRKKIIYYLISKDNGSLIKVLRTKQYDRIDRLR